MWTAAREVSVLYREPKVLKPHDARQCTLSHVRVSVLYREPKVLKRRTSPCIADVHVSVSVLYREPKVLKVARHLRATHAADRFQCSTVSRKY